MRVREYIPDRKDKASDSALAQGFTKLRRCDSCERRRSFTQFDGPASVCNQCVARKK